MDPLLDIAEDHNLRIIEDSAETIGGEYSGQKTGTFGVGCFSFYPTKNITTGEGGILTTDDDELAARIRAFVGHGIEDTTLDRENADESWYRAASYAGYNYRMSNIQAAIGVEQMKRIETLNERRREYADRLTTALRDIPYVEPPVELDDRRHVYQMYTIRLDPAIERDEFVKQLNDRGVGASVHFDPPVHRQPRYDGSKYGQHDLSATEKVASTIVTLPMFPGLSGEDIEMMIKQIEITVEALSA
jgi:perosamine synthetase